MFSKNQKAFTAVETLLAIGIIAATAGISVPMYRNYQIRTDLDTVAQQTIQGLRRAQLLAQTGEHDISWGYYIQEGVLFAGEAYVVRNTDFDEVYPVPSTVNTSGLSEVVFSRIDGVPDRTGDIIIQGLNGDQRIITVGTYGIIDATAEESEGDDGGIGDDGGDIGSDGDTGGDGNASTGGDGDTGSSGDAGTDGSAGDTGSSDGDDGSIAGTVGGTTGGDTGSSDGGSDGGTGGDGGGGDDDDDDTPQCEDRFLINADGSVETTGTVSATFEALGTAITYGAGGPAIDVRVEASVNNGETWFDLFSGKPVKGGETQVVSNLVSGSKILLRVNGRYSWLFRKEYESNDGSGHIEVLKNQDSVPDYPVFGNQQSLTNFLQPIISDGKISIGQYDAVYLVELGNLGTSSADFQDAVIKVSFELTGSCSTGNVPRFKVTFPRLENTGDGNAKNHVLVGEQGVPYAEGQWVALEDDQGNTLIDNFLTEEVEGMAAWRSNGYVRFLQHGSHGQSGKEIVDALITFDNATVTNIVNDTNQNKTENWQDGIINDGAGGDEVTLQTGSQSVLYQTRVTVADDAIFVYWQEGDPVGGSTGGDGGGTDGGSDGGSADDSDDDPNNDDSNDDSGGGNEDDDTPDPCAVAYTISNGMVTINEPADVTFRALGSHAYYGTRGPEISAFAYASFNGGSSYEALFDNRDIDGGERQTFSDVSSGSRLVVKGDGRYSWQFRNSVASTDTNRVKLLQRKGALPGTTPFQNVRNLQGFMQNIIDGSSRVDIGKTSLVFAFELQNVDNNSDYQDIAVEVFLEKPASEGICGGATTGDTGGNTTGGATGETGGDTGGGGENDDEDDQDDNEPQVTICHFPKKNKKQPETLTIGESSLKKYLKKGAREGACDSDADGDTVPNKDDLCPNTYTPESVPTTGSMLFRRYALTKDSPVFTTGPRKKFVGKYSLADTKGCSCEQLVDVAERKKAYHFKQVRRLHRNVKSLFPFYTRGARSYGCGDAILRMVKNYKL